MEDVSETEFIEGKIEGFLVSDEVEASHIAHIFVNVLSIDQESMSSIVGEIYFHLILCLKQ